MVNAGGFGAVIENAKDIPGFFSLNYIASPEVGENGMQIVENGVPLFGPVSSYGVLTMLSMLAWGLGYFGVPQVLLRFMAIRKPEEIKRSRRIATVWVVISLSVAVFIGILGRYLMPINDVLLSKGGAENVFIELINRPVKKTSLMDLVDEIVPENSEEKNDDISSCEKEEK